MLEDLIGAIRKRQAILFAGAGVSMTVGLPSWRTLIEHIAEELDIDLSALRRERTSTTSPWPNSTLRQGSIGPLRSWMDRNWTIPEDTSRPPGSTSSSAGSTSRSSTPRISTATWRPPSTCTAGNTSRSSTPRTSPGSGRACPDRQVSRRFRRRRIHRAGGNRLSRPPILQSALDIKFRSDTLGKTILFIGYSMTDLNIRFLYAPALEDLGRSGYERDRPPSYVFMLRPNPLEEAVLEQWGLRVLTEKDCPPGQALENLFGQARRGGRAGARRR